MYEFSDLRFLNDQKSRLSEGVNCSFSKPIQRGFAFLIFQVISAQQLPKPADTKGETRTKGEVGQDPDMSSFAWLLSQFEASSLVHW